MGTLSNFRVSLTRRLSVQIFWIATVAVEQRLQRCFDHLINWISSISVDLWLFIVKIYSYLVVNMFYNGSL